MAAFVTFMVKYAQDRDFINRYIRGEDLVLGGVAIDNWQKWLASFMSTFMLILPPKYRSPFILRIKELKSMPK